MADLKKRIYDILKTTRVMQLATTSDNKPWVCNVHFYADENFNIYWISTPTRRHSLDIEKNPHVAITIKVHEDKPDEQYVIGLSAEGTAERIVDQEVKNVINHYQEKLGKDKKLMSDILTGKNPHRFYRLKPTSFVLFDSKNFPENPRQEYKV
ncbi:MAG: pyridoxamine 5'-phosphate oxidase family protein [Candidatus Levyibacteriota bacterium]